MGTYMGIRSVYKYCTRVEDGGRNYSSVRFDSFTVCDDTVWCPEGFIKSIHSLFHLSLWKTYIFLQAIHHFISYAVCYICNTIHSKSKGEKKVKKK